MRAAAILSTVALLAGCGTAAHTLANGGAPSLAATCGALPSGLRARTAWLHTSDGVRLYAATAGKGTTAVALMHESGAGICGWLETMRWLSANRIRAVAIALRGYPPSDAPRLAIYHHYAPDIQAAIDAAHTLGATHVFVLGASLGGAATVAEAPKLRHVAGVISLSGELQLPTAELDAIGAAPHITVPFLLVGSRADPYLDGPSAHRLFAAVGTKDKQVRVFPGGYHGWDLIDVAPYRRRVRASILAWLAAHAR